MPCGVETTKRIVETIAQSDKPLTIIELATILNRPRPTIRDGINNILETGTPRLTVRHVRAAGRMGRPERSYAIRSDA